MTMILFLAGALFSPDRPAARMRRKALPTGVRGGAVRALMGPPDGLGALVADAIWRDGKHASGHACERVRHGRPVEARGHNSGCPESAPAPIANTTGFPIPIISGSGGPARRPSFDYAVLVGAKVGSRMAGPGRASPGLRNVGRMPRPGRGMDEERDGVPPQVSRRRNRGISGYALRVLPAGPLRFRQCPSREGGHSEPMNGDKSARE